MPFGSKENIDDFLSNIWQALAIEGRYMFDGTVVDLLPEPPATAILTIFID